MSFIYQITNYLSIEETQLLEKGLTFCPDSDFDVFEIIKDLQLPARKLILQTLYAKHTQPSSQTTQ